MKNGMVVEEDGTKLWYLNGKRHRVDGPAWEFANGSKYWYLNGLVHREDGPAVEWPDGSKFWYLNGKKHRNDGPAIELAHGSTYWWLNHVELFHPESFDTMDSWIQYLNDNEEQTYQVIHDINGIIETIKGSTRWRIYYEKRYDNRTWNQKLVS